MNADRIIQCANDVSRGAHEISYQSSQIKVDPETALRRVETMAKDLDDLNVHVANLRAAILTAFGKKKGVRS